MKLHVTSLLLSLPMALMAPSSALADGPMSSALSSMSRQSRLDTLLEQYQQERQSVQNIKSDKDLSEDQQKILSQAQDSLLAQYQQEKALQYLTLIANDTIKSKWLTLYAIVDEFNQLIGLDVERAKYGDLDDSSQQRLFEIQELSQEHPIVWTQGEKAVLAQVANFNPQSGGDVNVRVLQSLRKQTYLPLQLAVHLDAQSHQWKLIDMANNQAVTKMYVIVHWSLLPRDGGARTIFLNSRDNVDSMIQP